MDRVYTTYQVSQYCGVVINTVKAWIRKGELTAYKTLGGHRRILRDNLIEFLRKNNMPIHPDLIRRAKRILVVEDDPSVLKMLIRVVESMKAGIEIETAEDGFQAGRKFEAFKPDLVILDLMLPRKDGFQVCASIRKGGNAVKIVAVTGHDTPEHRRRILGLGADAYFGKPFIVTSMISTLSALLRLPAMANPANALHRIRRH